MPVAELRWIERCAEFRSREEIDDVPSKTRGVYTLLLEKGPKKYDVVYVGMAGGPRAGIQGRLKKHRKKPKGSWTHFSIYKVWDNIRQEDVEELECLFRHIYRKDTRANRLNLQRSCKKLKNLTVKNLKNLKE